MCPSYLSAQDNVTLNQGVDGVWGRVRPPSSNPRAEVQPLLPRDPREGSEGVQPLPSLSKGSSSSLCAPRHWAVLQPCRARTCQGRAGRVQAQHHPLLFHHPLRGQNTSVHSIIYTVFANDSDTGNASKVSYGIEEVSTERCGVGHHTQTPPLGHPCGAEVLGDTARTDPYLWGCREVWGNGCKVLHSFRLGMNQLVGGPHGSSLAEGGGQSPCLCWDTSAPCLGDTG